MSGEVYVTEGQGVILAPGETAKLLFRVDPDLARQVRWELTGAVPRGVRIGHVTETRNNGAKEFIFQLQHTGQRLGEADRIFFAAQGEDGVLAEVTVPLILLSQTQTNTPAAEKTLAD